MYYINFVIACFGVWDGKWTEFCTEKERGYKSVWKHSKDMCKGNVNVKRKDWKKMGQQILLN